MSLLDGQRMLVFRQNVDTDPEDMLCTIGVSAVGASSNFEILTAAANAWDDNVIPLCVTSYNLRQIDLVLQVGTETSVASLTVDQQGTLVEDAAPQNVTYLLRKITTATGRGRNGRLYLPGVAEDLVDNTGTLDGGQRVGLEVAFNTFNSDFVAALDGELLVVNRSTGGGSTPEITEWACDPRVATQRRRLRP